jgi:DNA-binding NarL/FixJ family response regulator
MALIISIGVIEDHNEFRQSLEYLISSFTEYKMIWSHASVGPALDDNDPPDIILLDINLPDISGIDAIPLLKKQYPEVKIIMLTILEDGFHVLEALKNGADGYIIKKTNPNKILDAIQQVFEGGAALTPVVARQVLNYLKPAEQNPASASKLTAREKEILVFLTRGMTPELIASRLYISPQTVRNHIKSIYLKLQVHNRAEVVSKAIKDHLV